MFPKYFKNAKPKGKVIQKRIVYNIWSIVTFAMQGVMQSPAFVYLSVCLSATSRKTNSDLHGNFTRYVFLDRKNWLNFRSHLLLDRENHNKLKNFTSGMARFLTMTCSRPVMRSVKLQCCFFTSRVLGLSDISVPVSALNCFQQACSNWCICMPAIYSRIHLVIRTHGPCATLSPMMLFHFSMSSASWTPSGRTCPLCHQTIFFTVSTMSTTFNASSNW